MPNNFDFKNITNKNFSKKKLVGYAFRKACLKKVNFSKSNLEKVDFWNSDLEKVNFKETNLNNCILSDTDLSKTIFFKTNFLNSNLSHCNLNGLNLKNSTFNNVNLRDAIYNNKTIWPKKFDPIYYGAIKLNNNNKNFKDKKKNPFVDKVANELKNGSGFYAFKNYFSHSEINKAKKIILKTAKIKSGLAFSSDKKNNQKSILNLIALDNVFKKMIQPKIVMNIFEKLLGKKFICGHFYSNSLFSGARGQKPHLDYPYLGMENFWKKFPINASNDIIFNCQSMILLDDFTDKNGATEFVPGSQKFNMYPNQKIFDKKKIKMLYPKGTLIIFNGLAWHASSSNFSYNERIAVLGQYLPFFIKPMSNLKNCLKKNEINKLDARLRQLLGIDLIHPVEDLKS
jgi:ectoine hydroxylase-related dioxygenase (phytanoyl-CoA dioxygenase family)